MILFGFERLKCERVEFQFGLRAENRIKDTMDAKMKQVGKFKSSKPLPFLI